MKKIFKKIRQYFCDHEYYEATKLTPAWPRMGITRSLFVCPKCKKKYIGANPNIHLVGPKRPQDLPTEINIDNSEVLK